MLHNASLPCGAILQGTRSRCYVTWTVLHTHTPACAAGGQRRQLQSSRPYSRRAAGGRGCRWRRAAGARWVLTAGVSGPRSTGNPRWASYWRRTAPPGARSLDAALKAAKRHARDTCILNSRFA